MKKRWQENAVAELQEQFPGIGRQTASRARLFLGAGREDQVAAITNEVLYELWKRQMRGSMPLHPEAWASRLAQRLALGVLKSRGSQRAAAPTPSGGAGQSDSHLPALGFTSSSGDGLAFRFQSLHRILAEFNATARTKLDRQEQLLVEFVCRRRMTDEQAAFELGLTPAEVRKLWAAVMRKVAMEVYSSVSGDELSHDLLRALLRRPQPLTRRLVDLLRFVAGLAVADLERTIRHFVKERN